MLPHPDALVEAVVLDLFGTLVAAPTHIERAQAASQLAPAVGCNPAAVERYLRDTWQVRHDGTVPTLADLAAHVVRALGGPDSAVQPVAEKLSALGSARLVPDASVVRALRPLRARGLRLGVLSDASAEIMAAWPTSSLAAYADTAVFSCAAGCTKPDQRLWGRIRDELGVPAHQILYVGDGGGDELRGALAFGMAAVAVRRRGPADALAFGITD